MQQAAQPPGERLLKALHLGEWLQKYFAGSSEHATRHVAWCLLTKCVREALSYDVRVLPFDVVRPMLERHAGLMRDGVSAVLGRKVSDHQWSQLQLPGPLGGFGVRLPMASADAAYVATYFATVGRVKTLCKAMGKPTRSDIGKSEAENAIGRLLLLGVCVDPSGRVNFTEVARRTYEKGPWHRDTKVPELLKHQVRHTGPAQGQGSQLHSRIMRALEALNATVHVLSLPSDHLCEVNLSAGGSMT